MGQPPRKNRQPPRPRQHREGRAEELEPRHRPPPVPRVDEREQPRFRMRPFVRVSRVDVVHRCPMHFRMIVRDRIVPVSHHHRPRMHPDAHRRQPLPSLLRETLHRFAHPRHDALEESPETRLRAPGEILRVPAADVAVVHGGDGDGFRDEARSEITVDLVHAGEVIHRYGGREEGKMGHGSALCGFSCTWSVTTSPFCYVRRPIGFQHPYDSAVTDWCIESGVDNLRKP